MRRLLAGLLLGLTVWTTAPSSDGAANEPAPQARAVHISTATAYNPATDVWWSGYKTRTRTLCIELHGTSARWPWNTVAWGYYKAGLHLYPRPAGGCAAFPADKKVIVRTYSRADRKCAYTLVWRWNPKTGKHDGPLMQRAEIWLNVHPATANCRAGRTFPSVVTHETGHVFGMAHTRHPRSAMNGDWVYPQWVDVQRLKGLYWKTPIR